MHALHVLVPRGLEARLITSSRLSERWGLYRVEHVNQAVQPNEMRAGSRSWAGLRMGQGAAEQDGQGGEVYR